MKGSIRLKLFTIISGLILFFVISTWLINSQLLEHYYLWQKKSALMDQFNTINKVYENDPQSIAFELELLDRAKGIHILILDMNMNIKFNSSKDFEGLRPMHFTRAMRELVQIHDIKLASGEKVFQIIRDPRLNASFISIIAQVGKTDYIMLSTPLEAIRESAQLASRFYLIIGFVTFILGSVLSLYFSNRFSRPIKELNALAQNMARLDFSQKYKGKSEDEIGELGSSINCMSNQLDKSISELRTANEKLLMDVERERKIDEMRKTFISSVSHELKTPIALIKGYAEGLKLNINEDEENKNFYCEVINDEAEKMDKMVKDLLNLSQIESGFYKLEVREFSMNELINTVLAKYQPLFQEKNIEINKALNALDLAFGDILRIEQVITNLLNNAIDHAEGVKRIDIKTKASDGKLKVSISNTGNQIPAEEIDKIWQSFYKLDKARTRAHGGVGLGLSIVKSIMLQHGNNFGVENSDTGVSFWFELNLVDIK